MSVVLYRLRVLRRDLVQVLGNPVQILALGKIQIVIKRVILHEIHLLVVLDVIADAFLEFLDLLDVHTIVLQRAPHQFQLAYVPLMPFGLAFQLGYTFRLGVVLLALLEAGL